MDPNFSTHHLELGDEVVIKRYASWDRGEPHREWTALTLLAEYAPGLAPAPIEAALDADPPVITMSRLPGRVLRGTLATGEQLAALATALNLLHQIPAQVVEAVEPAPWGPVVAVDKVRTLADKQPDLGEDLLVRRAFQAGAAWLASATPDKLTTNPLPPVLGLADGNHANVLWDDHERRVWLIDWEDSGRSDRAFELGEVTEHISRVDGTLNAERLLAHIDLAPGEAERVRDFRLLIALGWFLQLGPDGPATPHNPVGTLERQAERVLHLLG
ncbi:aminoglycoside phosphotransferase family protein [Streptosporangium sp. NBC_01755]|uniref:phosphotransferase family protein n=1 Tax=unclassified Streptosporangium TaxID=2632669 RepID=UPI002DD88F11|nr:MULTISPECIES: phosphotransferase [unclassified Streptosporangium]WSA24036.1 aminoglycoside phosphotransferase family protein [Streptosporangium sp. NBC_01810]WSC97892.1 aminoglycoside phosphotransferase family protein [Streptosporangium sp. NBC_01755]